jgi:mannosyltransferase OCH1-like enzyme
MNIIQTWKTKIVPGHYENFVRKVKNLNLKWNYMFFDDDDILDFIQMKMPEYYGTFCELSGKIQQIDFFRYLAIYYYGGVYLDLDIDLVRGLDDFSDMDYNCVFPIEVKGAGDHILASQGVSLIGNYAFYAPKGHPFLKKIIDNIVTQRIPDDVIRSAQENHTDDSRDVYVYYRTGPMLVSQSYVDYQKEQNDVRGVMLIESIPYEDNRFGIYGYHRCYGSWRHVISDQTPI